MIALTTTAVIAIEQSAGYAPIYRELWMALGICALTLIIHLLNKQKIYSYEK